ncbi:MAG: N-6 DNA methylase [Lachnospiraceae bacterium]|nr:N-6 DNA methylase [Lachnospiraceae bacterium]
MTDMEQRKAAKEFAAYWTGKGDEKGESQKFWLSLLGNVFGIEHPEQFISFEDRVFLGHTSFIDGYIEATKVLIEQKAIGKDLKKPIKQSDGSLLTPFQQAKRYITELPVSKHPRWVVTCNFEKFFVYDMDQPGGDPEEILLENLPDEYYRLQFLVDSKNHHLEKEMEVSMKAGEIVGLLYDAFQKQYVDATSEYTLKSLNVLCVRLVFCLFAEDAGIFGRRGMFHDYLEMFDTKHMRKALIELFQVLDTKPEERDPYLEPELAAFPYVNGGLFQDEKIEIPLFTEEIRELLLTRASKDFDWSDISPTIFGAVFESTLNPETRRSGGMHYTSIENIHKVIDPLFLDDLKKELSEICEISVERTKVKKLKEFQSKLASLCWLDPACGSGNFLTETYLSIRRLENQALKEIHHGQMVLDFGNPIQVSIGQFYGIEINDFAVTVAKTALWIAESQMMKQTEDIVHMDLDFLPLKSYANIVEGNALRIDWESVVPKYELNYIMGNPPFSAGRRMGTSQRKDMNDIAYDFPKNGDLDYVCLWYIVAARYMQNTAIKAGFVSTSSITQGEQVILLWKNLFEKYKLNIVYAIRSFNWQSEAKIKAGVHCVIIEFVIGNYLEEKYINDGGSLKKTNYINGYLMEGKDIWISGQKKPIFNVPLISNGSKPLDNAICAFTPEEKTAFLQNEPMAEPYFYRYMGSREFINNIERWFLIINKIPPHLLAHMPHVLHKLEEIKEYRLNSGSAPTRKLAETPAKFHFENMPDKEYLVIPQTSSGRRRYIPIGFLKPDILVNNKLQVMRDGGLYEFGVLSSNVHNAWLRTVAGRLREDFTYSVSVVYNTFPWPLVSEQQKLKIEATAQGIIDARAKYADSSLAVLYNELTMPSELRKAHQQNDKAVMDAYGFKKGSEAYSSESGCVAELMNLYQQKVLEKADK